MAFILWNTADVDAIFVCFVSLTTFLDQKEKKKNLPNTKANKEKGFGHKIPKTETKLVEWGKTGLESLSNLPKVTQRANYFMVTASPWLRW